MFRSLLVVPPLVPGLLEKSLTTPADAILIELEDGVHKERKDEARSVTREFLTHLDAQSKTVVIRVNDVLTPVGQEDLRALSSIGAPVALLLPKVRARDEVEAAARLMTRAETDASIPVGTTKIWVMVETTDGVLDLPDISRAPRVSGLVMGSADLSSEIRVRKVGVGANRPIWDFPLELLYAKQRAVLVARSRGLTIIDTGYTTISDLAGMRNSALVSAQLGFDGTAAFSPRQLPIIHEEFTPTDEEYDWACQAVAAVEAAEKSGETVVVMSGEMVEGPLIRGAHLTVRRYEEYTKRHKG
ncbi:HpcH/HpaI aldolase/citrate lyase family protein [Prauserella flavalba]|uniref:HpcH/HpaI aldolase/citrate lyase family protein n=1 Tax=Prauserella flavalba TaxID=1477506 RepID=UPI0036EE2952